MTDEQTPRSGSRWEPAPDDETVTQPATPPVPPAAGERGGAAAHAAATPVAPAGTRPWAERVRGNGGLVGAALALVLFSGVGGFAVGHAVAGPDQFGLVGERTPGGGFPAPGADGQLPPPRHGDDGDGFGTPPGAGDDGGSDDGGASQPGSTL